MKKNKLTLLSLIALLSVSSITLFSCSNEGGDGDTATTENFSNDDDTVVAKDDGIGTALPIGKRLAADDEGESGEEVTTPDVLRADMGILLTENDNDTYNLRYVAAFTGNDNLASATFTRDSYTNSNGKVVAAASSKVSYIYTSVHDSDSIKWASDTSVAYTYYMVYTIRNIPTSDIFTALNVSLSVTTATGDTLSAAQVANVYGVIGDISENVTYESYPTVEGTYSAVRKDTKITEAVVAPYYATFDGFVATKVGDVIALNVVGGSGSTGAFEGCQDMTDITLPDTIQYFGKYTFFRDSALKSMTMPRDLTTIESSNAFGGYGDHFKTLYYNAKNYVSKESVITWNMDTIYVSKDVETLPTYLISTSNTVNRVVYEGTTAEWNALKTDANKNNGLFIDNVMCSDSKIVTVNFHLNGSTIDGDDDTTDDLYTTSIIAGHAIANPGKPKKSGQVFKGWYSDAEFKTEYDFATIQDVADGEDTKTVDLYAKFEDYPAGSDINTALDLVNGSTVHVELTHDIQTFYYKITAPSDAKKDLYYLDVTNRKLNGEDTSKDFSLSIYDSDKTTKFGYTYTYAPDKASQYKVYGGATDNKVLLLEPGQTVYVAATVSYPSTLSDENAEFTFDLSLSTKENDYEGDATAYTVGETLKSKADTSVQTVETMKFTAPETKTYCARKIYTGYYYGTVMIYHYDNGSFVKDLELASTTVIGDLNAVKDTTYYIYCSTSNSTITDTKYMSVYVGDMPANYKPATATALPMDGTEETITVEGFRLRYYTVTPTKDGNYGLILNGGSSEYAKTIRVFKSDATSYTDSDVLISATETGTTSSSYGYGSTSYGGSVEATVALQGNTTYVIEVGFDGSSIPTYNNSFTFKAVERDAGDLKSIAYELTTNDDGTFADFAFDGKTSGKWFKYTAKASGFLSLYVDGLTNGNTATFQKYTSTGTKAEETQSNAMSAYVSSSGSATYYFYVETTAAQTGLTLKSIAPNETTLGDLSSLVIGSDTTARDVTLNAACNTTILKFTNTSTDSLYSKFVFALSAGTISFDWSIVPTSAIATTADSGKVTDASTATFGTKKLEAGKEYVLILKNIVMSDATATLNVTPSVEVIPPDGSSAKLALSLDDKGTYTFSNSGSSKDSSDYWLKFDCTESGTYKFYSSSPDTSSADPKIWAIYDGIDNATELSAMSNSYNDDHAGHSSNKYDYYVEVTLEAGHTYYFKMTPKNNVGVDVVVHVEKVEASA